MKITIPVFVSPVPKRETLKAWLDGAKVPRFKQNPTAKRGGGQVFYSVAGVEKFFRSRTLAAA
jgi:trehalose utilization protein